MTTATIEQAAVSEKLENLKPDRKITAIDRLIGYPKMASGISRYVFGKALGNAQLLLLGFLNFIAANTTTARNFKKS